MTEHGSKPVRIFLAGLAHETNTFSPLPTTLRSFREGVMHRGGDAATLDKAAQFWGYGDFLCLGRDPGVEVVAAMCAWAQPSGPVSGPVYESLRDALLAELVAAGPVDAVCLILHGAMVADSYADCEGDLLTRVRALVGHSVPVGALLDLHGNVTPAMAEQANILMACKEYPHTDFPERAREMLALLQAAARGGPQPRTLLHDIPMLGVFGTTEVPMREFVQRLTACEALPGILSVSAMHGFPWSDTAHTGACIMVVHQSGDTQATARARKLAGELAQDMFALRLTGVAPRPPIEEALDKALAAFNDSGPVVLADGADNPGGGAACDSTFVLQALLRRGVADAALGMLCDPQAAIFAADAGVGAQLPLRIGGKVGPLSGTPLDVHAHVLAVRADAHQRGMDGKALDPLGLTVAIRVEGVDVVINSIRQQVFSPDCFTELGIDVAAKKLVVVKSTQHFRAAFDAVAGAVVYCDAPGSLNGDLAKLPYRHLRRPMWPLDRNVQPDALSGGTL